jgi:LPS export ABC transporter protein LptC
MVPDTRLIRAEISLYDRQYVTARIIADTLVRFERFDSTMGYKVIARLLDTMGNVTTVMVGDSAVIRERSQKLQLYGHAVVTSGDTLKVESDYLEWNPEKEQLLTDKFVTIHRLDDVISGTGMTADRRLGRMRIMNQVSGSVRDIGEITDSEKESDSMRNTVPSEFTPERLKRSLDSGKSALPQGVDSQKQPH